MQSHIHYSDDNHAREATESSQLATSFRILATFTLISAFLQVAPLANAATDEEQNPAQPVNAVIEWNRTLLAIVRTPGAQ
ncbi:MAG TPA: hypothetical protein VK557_00885, partial [Pyrinomonadaceae bacterium]|nr:hypothetical protein [Pyrinomonadaceae bacterium]